MGFFEGFLKCDTVSKAGSGIFCFKINLLGKSLHSGLRRKDEIISDFQAFLTPENILESAGSDIRLR